MTKRTPAETIAKSLRTHFRIEECLRIPRHAADIALRQQSFVAEITKTASIQSELIEKANHAATRAIREIHKISAYHRQLSTAIPSVLVSTQQGYTHQMKAVDEIRSFAAEAARAVKPFQAASASELVAQRVQMQFSEYARLGQQFLAQLRQFAKELPKLPERDRKALQILGQEGWFLDPEMPQILLSEIACVVIEDPDGLSEWLCDFFRERLDNIEQELMEAYPHRKRFLCDAFEAHRERKYSLSVPAFLIQADGIFWEKSSKRKSLFIDAQRKKAVKKHASQISDYDAIYFYPLEISLPLWMSKGERTRRDGSSNELYRHPVLHGESVDYNTEENSLKAISLLSYLRWVLSKSEETVSS